MLDVGFSFPFGAVTDWLFPPLLPPLSMVDAELAWDWAFLLPLFGKAVPCRLTFALLPYFVLCNCLSFPRPLQDQRLPGLLVSPYHQAPSCARRRGPWAALGLWWGLKVRLHNAGRVGARGRGCVRSRDKAPAFPPSFLVVPGLTAPRREKDRDGTVRSEKSESPRPRGPCSWARADLASQVSWSLAPSLGPELCLFPLLCRRSKSI